ncbi:hypothetical protein ACFOEM_05620 [Paenalcaligenes hominis]|uniref:hypothetical protein n=1 Tax=Paenalcaligenes hominis TaxID=643674 RepID=UPI00362059B1
MSRVKALIEDNPSFGYRTVAGLLSMNKNTVQRIFQLKGWKVRKRATGMRPRVQAPRFDCWIAQRALGNGSVPRLGWPPRLERIKT